jgi:hypothetical protein
MEWDCEKCDGIRKAGGNQLEFKVWIKMDRRDMMINSRGVSFWSGDGLGMLCRVFENVN